MKLSLLATALMGALLVSACGNTTQDRALSGAGIGAAAGGVGGAMTGNTVGGAVLGGAAGAAAGALTEDDQIDLGEPIWRR